MTLASTDASDNMNRIRRFGGVFGGIWLFYLAYPLSGALALPSMWQKIGGTAVVVGFGATFVATFWGFRNAKNAGRNLELHRAWSGLAVMAVLVAVLAVMIGSEAFGATIYMAVLAVMTLPNRQAWVIVVTLIAVVEIVPRIVPAWDPGTFFALQLVISAVAAWGITQVFARNHELSEARQQLADLAIVAERERLSRDLHDILGHSLTVITIKAELAGRLIDIDTKRAAREIAEVEELSRQALADVRSTVGGMHRIDVGVELVAACNALGAAGIEAQLPADADIVSLRNRELFGWTLREAVTNVIRHSGAGRCVVELGPSSISVADNGCGAISAAGDGNGLRGLAERVAVADGSLVVGRDSSGEFRVEVKTA